MTSSKELAINRTILIAFLLVAIAFIMLRCDKFIKPENDPSHSVHLETESHHVGSNCMTCHYSEGSGEGWFTIAGTVFDNFETGMLYAYDDYNSAPIDSLEIDGKGNVYTTDPFDFGDGKFFAIKRPGVAEKRMPTKITTGQCNLCHTSTTNRLSL
jgi:hypothetical protein